MVGLGRMGGNLVRRLMRDGHDCVVYDVNTEPIKRLEGEGATGTSSLKELAEKLDAPRSVWIMVPAGEITESSVKEVAEVLDSGDAIIDGGNSYYRDDIRRSEMVGKKGIDYTASLVGHGMGPWFHQQEPVLRRGGDIVLEKGMILAVEPQRLHWHLQDLILVGDGSPQLISDKFPIDQPFVI